MKIKLCTLLTVCMVAALPYRSNAQKKGAPNASAEDRQKLADAYTVLVSMATNGVARRNDVDDDHKLLRHIDFKQVNVAADRKACLMGWDLSVTLDDTTDTTSDEAKSTRYFVPLGKIDIRSMRIEPFTLAIEKEKGWSSTYLGFVLAWSYLDLGNFELPDSMNPGKKRVSDIGYMNLSTEGDAERAMKALTYAAKSCGAHETAF